MMIEKYFITSVTSFFNKRILAQGKFDNSLPFLAQNFCSENFSNILSVSLTYLSQLSSFLLSWFRAPLKRD
jgi:hypothetical protein